MAPCLHCVVFEGAALAVQPPVPHARGSGISGTKAEGALQLGERPGPKCSQSQAALGVLGCALFARREQATIPRHLQLCSSCAGAAGRVT